MEHILSSPSGSYLPLMSDEEFDSRIASLKTAVRDRRDRCIALGKAYLGIAFDDQGKEMSLPTIDAARSPLGSWTTKLGAMSEKP